MPRPKKERVCGCKFMGRAFKPTGIPMPELKKVVLFRDELEVLRLCDARGLTQEEAGARMGVSRGTVQRILSSARKKSAEALSGCMAIVFEDIGRSDSHCNKRMRINKGVKEER